MSADSQDVLAANIRQRRSMLGLGMRELGRKCGVSASTVLNAERGIGLTMTTARRLADGLGCTVTDLMAEPACPFCRDAPPPGYICATCGAGELSRDLAALMESGYVEAVTDGHGVQRFQPTSAGLTEATP